MDIFYPGSIPVTHSHIPENPPIRNPGPPVPAKHRMSLSYMGKAVHGIDTAFCPYLFLAIPDIGKCRAEENLQQIFFRQNICHLILINTVHVFRISQFSSIKMYLCKSIQAFKPQNCFGIFLFLFPENTPVYKMILHNGQGLLFIIPPVRVVQPSAICQILVNGTGNPGRKPDILTGYSHLPVIIQFLNFHLQTQAFLIPFQTPYTSLPIMSVRASRILAADHIL